MIMKNVVGIVNLHSNSSLGEITKRRPIASTSVLGRFSFIDFPLSNFANSGIAEIGVLIKEKPRSLFRHLGMGKEWNLNTKVGGISLLYNEQYANNFAYNHDINNLFENTWMLDNTNAEYVVIVPTHMLFRMDFSKVIEEHINSGVDVTVIYKKIDDAKEHFIGSSFITLKDNRVTSIKTNRGDINERNIFLESYVMKVSKLFALMNNAVETSHFFTLKDIVAQKVNEEVIGAYEYKGYLRCFDSLANYLKFSLELLDPSISSQLFDPEWPIFTRTYNSPPAKYGENAKVSNCYIANGAIIDGEVTNSIIGRGVVIGKNSKVSNSIIFSSSVIENNAIIDNVVIDKEVRVKFINELCGTIDNPLAIKQGDVV